jgi:large subunit ribosomal protein L25
MATVSLSATPRTETGKGAARKLRASGQVPGVIYGHAREPQSLAINTRDLEKLLASGVGGATVVELTVGGSTSRTLIREIQKHPFKRQIIHIDLQELVAGEMVTVSVPLRFVGTPDGVRLNGGILEETMHQVHLRVDPSNIPDHIDVDVVPLTLGHSLHVGDLQVPEGAEVMDDEGATVCVVSAPKTVTDTAAEPAAEGAAEPELIRKAKADEDEGK